MARQNLGKVACVPKGEYDNSATYNKLDIVTYNGSSYIAIQETTTGNVPTNTYYWNLLAQKGEKGEKGTGILSVEKTSTSGLVDTYTITYDDATTSTFQVTNGSKGDKGETGQNGIDGRGIESIDKTSTSGLVDTYTISYTDETTDTFEVTNGKDGDVTEEHLQEELDETTKMIFNIFPSVEDTGTEITLDETAEVKFKKIDLKGNTSQDGTPTPDAPVDVSVVSGDNTINICGKNLCPVSSSNFVPIATWSSLTGTNANTYTNGTKITLNSGTYTVTFSERENIDSIQINGLSPVLYGNGTFTISEKTDIYIRVKAQNNSNPVILKTQLERGSTATKFVPHELQSYPVNLGVENLFDGELELGGYDGGTGEKQSASNNYRNKNIIEVKPNTTYTFSINGVSQKYVLFYYTSSQSFISSATDLTTGTFTTPNNCYYINFRCFASDFTSDFANLKVQLEKGSKANSYTPFGTTPIELCKIGDYQDTIVKDNGKWYLEKQIGKVVLDGSESDWGNDGGSAPYSIYKRDMFRKNDLSVVLSNNFMGVSYSSNWDLYNYLISANTTANQIPTIRIKYDTNALTLDEFKNWLSTHNTIVYYVLQTPTTTEITDATLISQLEALRNATSYDNQTNISQTNDDLPFILTFEAIRSLKNIFN